MSTYKFKQALEIGVSNVIGVEVWNSYRTNYPYAAYIQADGSLLISLTNDLGISPTVLNLPTFGGANLATNMGAISLAAGAWAGTGWTPGDNSKPANPDSFKVPLVTNMVFLDDRVLYTLPSPALVPVPTNGVLDWTRIDPQSQSLPAAAVGIEHQQQPPLHHPFRRTSWFGAGGGLRQLERAQQLPAFERGGLHARSRSRHLEHVEHELSSDGFGKHHTAGAV